MSRRRQTGFSLLEMLAVVAALVVFTAMTAKPMRTMLATVPFYYRDFQAWEQTVHILEQLRCDIEQSERMTIPEKNAAGNDGVLCLECDGETIRYSLADGRISRHSEMDGQTSDQQWQLPHIRIRWQLWKRNTEPYAIEVATWSERVISGKTEQKFKQTHVYFQKTGSLNP